MSDRSRVLTEMLETMESLLEQIEENFDHDVAFRDVKRIAEEMKTELEEVLETYE